MVGLGLPARQMSWQSKPFTIITHRLVVLWVIILNLPALPLTFQLEIIGREGGPFFPARTPMSRLHLESG